jgi:hypothetical protein
MWEDRGIGHAWNGSSTPPGWATDGAESSGNAVLLTLVACAVLAALLLALATRWMG